MRWIAANKGPLPARHGPRPRTTSTNPHLQIDQQPVNAHIRESLTEQLFVLESVVERPSRISVPGARALCLEPSAAKGPPEAFMIGTEFAHLHPPPDLSLHLMLPEKLASDVVEAGWGELHLAAKAGVVPPTAVMLYAPRETEELAMVVGFAIESYRFARGEALPYRDGSAAVLDSEKYERESFQWGGDQAGPATDLSAGRSVHQWAGCRALIELSTPKARPCWPQVLRGSPSATCGLTTDQWGVTP